MGVLPSELRQWQESESLALTQFGDVVRAFLPSKLIQSSGFEGLWTRLLELTANTFLQGPADLSQASIKCFTSAISANVEDVARAEEADRTKIETAWQQAWESWVNIGEHIRQSGSQQVSAGAREDAKSKEGGNDFRFTQKNLLAYIQAFPPIHRILAASFDGGKVETLLVSLKSCVAYPHSPDNMSDRSSLTNVQEAARATARSVSDVQGVPSIILSDLSECICLAYSGAHLDTEKARTGPTFVSLSRSSIDEAFSVFVKHEDDASIYRGGAFEGLLSSLIIPIKLKYDCPESPTIASQTERKADARPVWQLATLTLCRILARCCSKLQSRVTKGQLELEVVERLWSKAVDGIQAAVLADSSPAATLSKGLKDADERFSLFLLSTIEKFVLPYLGQSEVPDHLIERVGRTLTLGSKLYSFETGTNGEDRSGRVDDPVETTNERFGYWCFDLLFLGCSAGLGGSQAGDSKEYQRLATILLRHLIDRCENVLLSFARDIQIRGMIPMHRARQEELNYVIQRYLELQLWPGTYSVSESAEQAAWHKSDRAHLFSAFRHLLLLLSIQQPSPGSSADLACIGTSLPPIIPADPAELAKTFADNGLELGIVGTTTDVLGAGTSAVTALKAAPRDLAAKALALVGDDLGICALPL